MSFMLHNSSDANNIEKELERYAIAINFNWEDKIQAKMLAIEFKKFDKETALHYISSQDRNLISKANFFGLANMMLELMASSANNGYEVHGGNVWKSFARELYKL